MNNPVDMRKAVLVRDRFTCQGCGFHSLYGHEFQVDHIKPLYEAYGDLSYYEIENTQLLCEDCHAEKTRADMERFRIIRG